MTLPPTRADFTAKERTIVERCRTPYLTQRWLKSLPYNHEERGETLRTFRVIVRLNTAHCLEATLAAATTLEQHGYPPLLLDLESWDDLDHVLFLFRRDGRWGTVAKSRDPGLFGRKPVFRTIRDVVRSYVDPYVDHTGRITGYGVLDLRTVEAVDWRLAERNVWKIQDVLIDLPHTPLRTSDRRYESWHARYERYKHRYPDRKPTYYSNRRVWL